jgi:hypothetical protein
VCWINFSVRAYICYEADEDQRHRLAIYSASRPADSGVTRAALLPTSSLRSCQTKATYHTKARAQEIRPDSSGAVCATPPSEMMRWHKMLY